MTRPIRGSQVGGEAHPDAAGKEYRKSINTGQAVRNDPRSGRPRAGRARTRENTVIDDVTAAVET